LQPATRRGFYDLAKAKAPIATEALQRIAALYEIEASDGGMLHFECPAPRRGRSDCAMVRRARQCQFVGLEKEGQWAEGRVGPDRLRLAMERWDSPIVVTTAVQFFQSLFSDRPSRCRKLHSLARSVVVVDEAQTMPLPLLRTCVAALKELSRNYGTSVVLCTATQPALEEAPTPEERGVRGGFKVPCELAPDVPALFAALRRVTVRDIGTQDDAALAARIETSQQALYIVNQRAHARALFRAIGHLPGAWHLSTCMHSVRRGRVLEEIRDDLKHHRPYLDATPSAFRAPFGQ
jgi:hypothetical protein